MFCIGDECETLSNLAPPALAPTGGPRLRSVALGALCAGLGYLAAQSHPAPNSAQHLIVIAPPLVMVSEIAD